MAYKSPISDVQIMEAVKELEDNNIYVTADRIAEALVLKGFPRLAKSSVNRRMQSIKLKVANGTPLTSGVSQPKGATVENNVEVKTGDTVTIDPSLMYLPSGSVYKGVVKAIEGNVACIELDAIVMGITHSCEGRCNNGLFVPLDSLTGAPKSVAKPVMPVNVVTHSIPSELAAYVPKDEAFKEYLDRKIDKRLAIHYDCHLTGARHKHPLTQGKQGTGKTMGHAYYAFQKKLPFFIFSCFEDFQLSKLFGDKTIENGTIRFKESLFVKAIQNPSVILFDEINAISNVNTFDFHALLQERELFIKDADDGKGKIYKLHPECRIGFAQNPKSEKYISGSIKPSNFLGRCTFITYPEFSRANLLSILNKKYKGVVDPQMITDFTSFYKECLNMIDKNAMPLDISIRQLLNTIDLWLSGLSLREAVEDGMASMTQAISQPALKSSFMKLGEATWDNFKGRE
jgi:hypothetical protein